MTSELQCNLSDQTAADFRRLIKHRDVSISEGVRRAIAVWKFVEDEVAAGNRLCVVEADETIRRVTLIGDDALWVVANPWRDRLLYNCWQRPFPYLLHRWEVMGSMGPCHGFFTRRGARRYIAEYEALPDLPRTGEHQ